MVVGVTKSDEASTRRFAESYEVNYPLVAEAAADQEAWGIDMIWGSVVYLVDPERRVVAEGIGDCEERLAAELAAADAGD